MAAGEVEIGENVRWIEPSVPYRIELISAITVVY
jgi:hypothetical protein